MSDTERKITTLICKIIVVLGFPFYMIAIVIYAFWLLLHKLDYKISYLEPATVGDLYKLQELANAGDKEAKDLMAKTSVIIAHHVFRGFYGDWISETLHMNEILKRELDD
jgi:hypothetical protein